MNKFLNTHLIKKQKLTSKDVEGLNQLHASRLELFQEFKKAKTLNEQEIQELVLELEDLEFNMQWVWKFNEDKNFHTWWHEVPNCSCESYMNLFGRPRVINNKCIIHGSNLEND
jgi:hypothetical protein